MRGRRLRAVFRGASLRSGRAAVRHGNPIRAGAGLVHAFGRARGAPLATQDWNNRKVVLGPARAACAARPAAPADCTREKFADARPLRPMTPSPLLYESHSHTTLCRHAVGTPEDYARMAERRGLRGIIFTCHCPLPDGISHAVRMRPEEYETYVDLVARARAAFAGRVDVRLGLESDFYPGVERWLEALHARVPLHHVLGSVHTQVPDYRARYFRGDWFDYQQTYFEHLAQAAESGLHRAAVDFRWAGP